MKSLFQLLLVATATLSTNHLFGQVLFSDSFDRVEGSSSANGLPADPNNFSSWGTNDNAFGGTVVNTWMAGPSRPGGANQSTDGSVATTINGTGFYDFDVTTLAPEGFSVSVDFNRFHPVNPGNGPGFVSIALGADSGAFVGGGLFGINNGDFLVLFQQGVGTNEGNTQFFADGVLTAPASSTDPGPLDYGDPLATHRVLVSMIPQVAGAYGETDLIDGSVSVDGGTPYEFTVMGGANFGSLALSSNQFFHSSWDNLVVRAIPEPTTLTTCILAVCSCCFARRW